MVSGGTKDALLDRDFANYYSFAELIDSGGYRSDSVRSMC